MKEQSGQPNLRAQCR